MCRNCILILIILIAIRVEPFTVNSPVGWVLGDISLTGVGEIPGVGCVGGAKTFVFCFTLVQLIKANYDIQRGRSGSFHVC